MENQKEYKITVAIISALLGLILTASLAAIFRPVSDGTGCIADIYQDGNLLASIPLDGKGAPYQFTVTGENGCFNEIQVCPHSIGILSADCPDKLCVNQGFIDRLGLPIVCLPNKLVIRLREADSGAVDAVAY